VKRFIFMVILAIVLVSASILECVFIKNTFDFLEDEVQKIETLLAQNPEHINTTENIKAITDFHEKWHGKMTILKTLVWHTGIKEVEIELYRAQSYIEENNYTEAKVELQNLLSLAEHYENDFKFSLENIF